MTDQKYKDLLEETIQTLTFKVQRLESDLANAIAGRNAIQADAWELGRENAYEFYALKTHVLVNPFTAKTADPEHLS